MKRDLQPYPIATDTTVLRSRTWERLKFEIEYGLARGTTANSFIIKGDTKALIDPPGSSFTDVFITGLEKRFDVKLIEYVILGHINPNRGETLKKLLELAPQITFVCSNPAAIALSAIL